MQPTAVIGDSIVRNIRAATTHRYPSTKAVNIVQQIPSLLSNHPHARNVVIHVGTNDIASQQSEMIKCDFNSIFFKYLRTAKNHFFFISGLIPSLHQGVGRFRRLLCLNTWLQSECSSHSIVLVDNFNLFWERASFSCWDTSPTYPE
uniref:SGNH hydrolase-type esterase domain-containing protein n=1 Tax=Seriola lalandi dorsalis TaxID=1841481 RepID=A0A3B4WVV8_SERLL